MRLRQWTKRIDEMHYAKPNASETLCGKAMIGNNYANENISRQCCHKCAYIITQAQKNERCEQCGTTHEDTFGHCSEASAKTEIHSIYDDGKILRANKGGEKQWLKKLK